MFFFLSFLSSIGRSLEDEPSGFSSSLFLLSSGIAIQFKIALKFAVAPSPLNTLLGNVPEPSGALLNKPVYCVLLGVSGAW